MFGTAQELIDEENDFKRDCIKGELQSKQERLLYLETTMVYNDKYNKERGTLKKDIKILKHKLQNE